MKKKGFIISALAAGGVFISFGYPFFRLLVDGKKGNGSGSSRWKRLEHPRKNHPRNGYENKYEEGRAWCMAQAMEDRFLTSRDGIRLHALWLRAEEPERIVLLSHGYRGSSFGDFANMAKFLHENGCDLLFVDQRCCGESGGRYITFGAKEQWDILDWTYMLASENDADLPIYLYGESMGAAAVLMAAGHDLPARVRGLICDCGFSSMKQQLRDIAAEWFHLDHIGLLLLRVDLFCRILADFRMSDSDTAKALSVNRVPVLFFHGKEDTFVSVKNSVRNHEACAAPNELVIIDKARHLCSAYADEGLYRKKVLEFFSDSILSNTLFPDVR
ncbi:MAG: alpha/beta hydrolase [Lachnospiraceae bacterium]|nr:alpha/beta hydrolase [Lachnospiraceae bacterium]